MTAQFRPSVTEDIPHIIRLIEQGRAFFKENGIPQWQNIHPNATDIAQDIANECSYLLQIENRVVATSAMIITPEPTYGIIAEGGWLTSAAYATIHRIAVDSALKGGGLAVQLINKLEALATQLNMPSMRVDTHRLNLPMQALLKKCGFTHCGLIYLPDGAERFGYEKILPK